MTLTIPALRARSAKRRRRRPLIVSLAVAFLILVAAMGLLAPCSRRTPRTPRAC
nr:hypothetical protein GCM10020093_009640 [Planobispora longispora]